MALQGKMTVPTCKLQIRVWWIFCNLASGKAAVLRFWRAVACPLSTTMPRLCMSLLRSVRGLSSSSLLFTQDFRNQVRLVILCISSKWKQIRSSWSKPASICVESSDLIFTPMVLSSWVIDLHGICIYWCWHEWHDMKWHDLTCPSTMCQPSPVIASEQTITEGLLRGCTLKWSKVARGLEGRALLFLKNWGRAEDSY